MEMPLSQRSNDQPPLVSIGVPVRNGAAFLTDALELIRQQTYRNLEIVISDNDSTDGTPEILTRFAASDIRVRLHRQNQTLTALENFRYVFEHSQGKYFMWAACDDRRSLDYVQRLVERLERDEGASLAFSDVAEVGSVTDYSQAPALSYPFETRAGESVVSRLRRYTRMNCLHTYGLIRSSALRPYNWIDIDSGPDIPLLVHLAVVGEFVRADGGFFYYYVPQQAKTREERAVTNNLREAERFPEVRLAWACAQTAHRTGEMAGRPIGLLKAFLVVYVNRHWRWIKPALFNLAPPFLVKVYRTHFKRESR